MQQLNLRNGNFRSLTCSVYVAEVTQVNSISVSLIQAPVISGSWPVAWGFRCQSSQAS